MNPQQIIITKAMAEAICGFLETLETDHEDTAAGLMGVEIRNLLVDVEAPEPPPDHEEEEPEIEAPEPPPDDEEEYPAPEPLELEIEAPEPCPDSLGDEDRAAWEEYNRNNEGEEILESQWLDFQEACAQDAVEAQLSRYPFP